MLRELSFHSSIIQSSQLSVNSVMSHTQARYELDVTGTIQLKLSYNSKMGTLDIFIKKCINLALNRQQQTPNPSVFLSSNDIFHTRDFLDIAKRIYYLIDPKVANVKHLCRSTRSILSLTKHYVYVLISFHSTNSFFSDLVSSQFRRIRFAGIMALSLVTSFISTQ